VSERGEKRIKENFVRSALDVDGKKASHLEVSELQRRGTLAHCVGSLFERPGGFHLALGGDNLSARLSGGNNQSLMEFRCLTVSTLTWLPQPRLPWLAGAVSAATRPCCLAKKRGKREENYLSARKFQTFLRRKLVWRSRKS
jgi:hypothetical protein